MFNSNNSNERQMILKNKLITLHSDDRDITKYPYNNNWSIQLPDIIEKVFSLNLSDFTFSSKNLPVFSKKYGNTCFLIQIDSSNNYSNLENDSNNNIWTPRLNHQTNDCSNVVESNCEVDIKNVNLMNKLNNPTLINDISCNSYSSAPKISECTQETALLRAGVTKPKINKLISNNTNSYYYNGEENFHVIEISEGYYSSPELLVNEINNSIMNIEALSDLSFQIMYSSINDSFYFIDKTNTRNIFLRFDLRLPDSYYEKCNNNLNKIWSNTSYWGLGYHLGFEKKSYSVTDLANNVKIPYDINNLISNDNKFLRSPKNINIKGPSVFYMEIDKYNSGDEIEINYNSNSKYLSMYNGISNSFFAKIFINRDDEYSYNYESGEIIYSKLFLNQLESKIKKLEFKFRFHDGRFVEFSDDFNFSLKFKSIVDSPSNLNNINVIE